MLQISGDSRNSISQPSSTTFPSMTSHSDRQLGALISQERREVINSIRALDVRQQLKSGGGRLYSREAQSRLGQGGAAVIGNR